MLDVDVEKIRQLIEMMVANDLVEVSLRDGEQELNLRRPNASAPMGLPHYELAAPEAPRPAPPPQVAAAGTDGQDQPADDDSLLDVISPMVGTFYAASDPESAPFVTVGSEVHPGSVLCVLEAMKVFNEIKAEVSGRIERILVKNAEPVEYGQPLFKVRPL